jgi:uncharacterized membrane protein
MVTLLGPGADFFIGYLKISGLDQSVGYVFIYTTAGVIVSLIQGFVGLVFLYFARALGKNLLAYMTLRRSISNQYNPLLQQLSAVVMALFMNGVLVITNILHTFFNVILLRSRDTPVAIVQGYVVLFPVLRIGLFYWQVLHNLSLLRKHVVSKVFSDLIYVSDFQIQLMKSRQCGSKTFKIFAAFYQFLCIQKRHSSSTVVPDVNAVNNAPQEEISDHNTSSSLWDDNTITSTSSAAVYDYCIQLPSLPQDRLQLQEPVVRNHLPAVLRGKFVWTT